MDAQEKLFRFIFILAGFIFCLVVIGVFLLLVKIALIWYPELNIMGINMTRTL